jgi:ribokinase
MPTPGKRSDLKVIVVGSYNTDLVIWCNSIPTKGQSLVGGEFEMYSGGRGANCAVAAARAGCQVKFIGARGADLFGKMAVDRLTREQIDIEDFIELPSSKTGVALMLQEQGTGAHAALVATSANNQFPATLVTKAEVEIRMSDLVFTQFEIGIPVLLEVFRLCGQHRKRLVLHASPVDHSTRLPAGHYYLLVADDFEAQLLAGKTKVYDAVRELHRRGAQNVILKHKVESLIFSDGSTCDIQPVKPPRLVQESGAVECLTAWAGITLAMTGSLARAAFIGAEALAFSLARHSAQDSMPYASELPNGEDSFSEEKKA